MESHLFFSTYVDTLKFEQSYATVNGERVVDQSKRSSKICTQKFMIDFPDELKFFCKTCQIKTPSKLSMTLYKYEEGDFFAQHVDRQRSDTHAYTLLLLPPCASELKNCFQGGNLKIGSTTINCSSITEYTYLIFNIDLLHELEPILKGTRFVFKSQLDVENNDVTKNAFTFTKPIYRNFNIEIESTTPCGILRSGDLNISAHIKVNLKDIDFTPNENETKIDTKNELPKSKGIADTLRDLISPDPSQQWASDYDAGYHSQPAYRKGLYLRNKINRRMGRPMLMD